jgi:DNA-binding transcriptional LysR family regulator
MRPIAPFFEQIAAKVEALGELRDKLAGTIRVYCTDDSIELCLRSMFAGFLKTYPDITLELVVAHGFTNMVEEPFDAGIHFGETISKGMIAVHIGPDWRRTMGQVASVCRTVPVAENTLRADAHTCVNIRHRPSGSIYA